MFVFQYEQEEIRQRENQQKIPEFVRVKDNLRRTQASEQWGSLSSPWRPCFTGHYPAGNMLSHNICILINCQDSIITLPPAYTHLTLRYVCLTCFRMELKCLLCIYMTIWGKNVFAVMVGVFCTFCNYVFHFLIYVSHIRAEGLRWFDWLIS